MMHKIRADRKTLGKDKSERRARAISNAVTEALSEFDRDNQALSMLLAAAAKSLSNTGHSLESSTALFAYIDLTAKAPGYFKTCSADMKMKAIQEINLTAIEYEVSYEEALASLFSEMKDFLDYQTAIINKEVEVRRTKIAEETAFYARLAFDAQEKLIEKEEQRRRQAEAYASAVAYCSKHMETLNISNIF
jgi:hypothetical protein